MTADAAVHDRAASTAARRFHTGRNLLSGLMFGVAVAAFVDETVFHQLLHWHHFYDRATPEIGLVSDGIFHAFGWFAGVAALFLLADLHRLHAVWWLRWSGGVATGAGAFQLYDGTIQHKVMGLHEIRYGVDLAPYDLVWNVVGAALLLSGASILIRTRRSRARA